MDYASNLHRRFRLPQDEDGDGPLWADLWMNIAVIFIYAVYALTATAYAVNAPDQGASLAEGQGGERPITTIHLVQDPAGTPSLHLGERSGPEITDNADLERIVGESLNKDPRAVFVVTASGDTPYTAFVNAARRLSHAGADEIGFTETLEP